MQSILHAESVRAQLNHLNDAFDVMTRFTRTVPRMFLTEFIRVQYSTASLDHAVADRRWCWVILTLCVVSHSYASFICVASEYALLDRPDIYHEQASH